MFVPSAVNFEWDDNLFSFLLSLNGSCNLHNCACPSPACISSRRPAIDLLLLLLSLFVYSDVHVKWIGHRHTTKDLERSINHALTSLWSGVDGGHQKIKPVSPSTYQRTSHPSRTWTLSRKVALVWAGAVDGGLNRWMDEVKSAGSSNGMMCMRSRRSSDEWQEINRSLHSQIISRKIIIFIPRNNGRN